MQCFSSPALLVEEGFREGGQARVCPLQNAEASNMFQRYGTPGRVTGVNGNLGDTSEGARYAAPRRFCWQGVTDA